MRKIFLIICMFSFSGILPAQGIEFFDGTWEEALAKAKEEEKLIFVDAYTKWCGPCKRMAKDVFTQEKVGALFNEKFINAKMDMEEEKNMSFISKYPVRAYPTLFFINGEGKVIHQVVGGQQAEGLLNFASEAEKKDDRSVNFVEAYEAGKRDHKFVIDYIRALNKSGKPSLKVSNDYLKRNPNLSGEKLNEFLIESVTETDSKLFDKLVENKKGMMATFGEDLVKKKVASAAANTVKKAINFEIMDLVEDASSNFALFHSKQESEDFELSSNISYYKGTGQVENYIDESEKYFKKCAKKDNKKLGSIMGGMVAHKSDTKAKVLMLKVSKQMVKNEETWRNLVTYSNALMLNNNPSKALEAAKRALSKTEVGKEKRVIQSLIDRIEAKV